MSDNAKDHKKLYVKIGVLALVLLACVAGYIKGYRIKDNFLLGKVGLVSMNIPLVQTTIYVDQNKTLVTDKENQDVKIALSPRTHDIIISRVGYFPWTKQITVPSDRTLTLVPIFILVNPTGEIITQKDPQYWTIRNTIVRSILPSKNTPLFSLDKSTKIWMEDNAILVNTASSTHSVIQPDTIIKSVDFYKNRRDVLIFSTRNGVYAIETNREGSQNFMPIYKGTDPYFIKSNEGSIYILDGETLMQVVI